MKTAPTYLLSLILLAGFSLAANVAPSITTARPPRVVAPDWEAAARLLDVQAQLSLLDIGLIPEANADRLRGMSEGFAMAAELVRIKGTVAASTAADEAPVATAGGNRAPYRVSNRGFAP